MLINGFHEYRHEIPTTNISSTANGLLSTSSLEHSSGHLRVVSRVVDRVSVWVVPLRLSGHMVVIHQVSFKRCERLDC